MADRHLDDDGLSELLDAPVDAFGAERAHVAACQSCTDRLARFDAAQALIRSPIVPLDATTIDRLVETAVAETTVRPARAAATVVPIDRRRRLRAPAPAWLAAVAAALVLLLAVPALLDSGDDDGGQFAGMERDSTAAFEAGDDAGAGSSAGRATPTSDAAGEQAGDAGPSAPAALEASPAAGGSVRSSSKSLGSVDDGDELVRRLVAILSTEADEDAGDDGRCTEVARDVGSSRLGSLVYTADVTWRGQSAVVVVFTLAEPSGDTTRQAYVMTTEACSVLAEPRF